MDRFDRDVSRPFATRFLDLGSSGATRGGEKSLLVHGERLAFIVQSDTDPKSVAIWAGAFPTVE